MKKHGLRKHPLYRKWASMKNRCLNPNEPAFKYYGGRGITVSEPWLNFENFYTDMGECPEGMQLDRADNSKGYSKENCRWVSRLQNANNRRNNKALTYNGETKNQNEWARELNITHGALIYRLKTRSPDEAFSDRKLSWEQPKLWKYISAFGKTLPLKEWSRITGLKRTTISERLKRGMTPEVALSRKIK